MTEQDRFRGCLLGLAVGDAVGTTLEFKPYGSFKPITDMVGGGPFRLKPGEWTDDTSMALCLATSLAETGVFNPKDQMDRYCRWRNDGYLSSNGRCFDIGNTVAAALNHYQETHDRFAGSTDPRSAGTAPSCASRRFRCFTSLIERRRYNFLPKAPVQLTELLNVWTPADSSEE